MSQDDGMISPQTVLVLQGGGALGAYQAGVYEALADTRLSPDWIAGISIGAINAAIIAGNPPERRVERLRAFWNRVSGELLYRLDSPWGFARRAFNEASAMIAASIGVPGFFTRAFPPSPPNGRPNSASSALTTLRHCARHCSS